jgi:hypothetical protein
MALDKVNRNGGESGLEVTMSLNRYHYRVVLAQDQFVTFVNGEWNGSVDMNSVDGSTALSSCPKVHEYLQAAGADGWELVTVTEHRTESSLVQTLYLKRSSY